MARIRTIKPELLEDEKVARLSSANFRLFVGLILLSDDYGNFRASPEMLRGQIFWGEDAIDIAAVDNGLLLLADIGLVQLYEANGQSYGHLSGWQKHQRVDKPGNPRVPGPADQGSFVPLADECTYIAQRGETGPIKIGRSWNVEDRLRRLATGSAEPLRLLAKIPGGDNERVLHQKFATLRKRGEWFEPAPALLKFIEELRNGRGFSSAPGTFANIPGGLATDLDPIRSGSEQEGTTDPAGASAQARSNDDARAEPTDGLPPPLPLTPVDPEQRRWPAEEWFEAFRVSWLTYQKGSYGGRPNDFSAIAKLRTILANLPLDEALAAQKRSGQMFAEYFGDRGEEVAKARHPWSWFVQRFDGLRFPEKSGPKDDRCAFHRRGYRGRLPREGAHDTCPECRFAKALTTGRTGEPTTAGDALVAATEKKAAELRRAAEKSWTPEQLEEMRQTLQRERAQPKAAAS